MAKKMESSRGKSELMVVVVVVVERVEERIGSVRGHKRGGKE